MDRRSFLKGSAAAGAAAAAVAASNFPAPAIAQGKIEWRMVTSWPKNFPGLGTAAESIAQKITTMSGGRLTVKVFAAGELVPAFGAFDAAAPKDLREGRVDQSAQLEDNHQESHLTGSLEAHQSL